MTQDEIACLAEQLQAADALAKAAKEGDQEGHDCHLYSQFDCLGCKSQKKFKDALATYEKVRAGK